MKNKIKNTIKIFIIPIILGLSLFLIFQIEKAYAIEYYEISDGSINRLYHLENLISAVSSTWNLSGVGNISTTTAKFNAGYLFPDGLDADRLSNPSVPNHSSSTYSIGIWFCKTGGIVDDNYYFFADEALVNMASIGGVSKTIRVYNDEALTTTSTIDNNACDSPDDFHLLIYTNQNNTGKIYVDGDLKISGSSTGKTLTTVIIGNRTDGTAENSFKGILDEYFLVNKVLSNSEIIDLWNNGTGKEICITAGCGTSANGTITFSFPVEGTSTYPFDYWRINLTSLSTTSTYRTEIRWQALLNGNALSNIIVDKSPYLFAPLASTTLLIPKTTIGIYVPAGTTSTQIQAWGYLYNQNNLIQDSATIIFNILRDSITSATTTFVYVTTSTQQNVNTQNTANPFVAYAINNTSSSSPCNKPDGITDVGGGIAYGGCEIFNFLFKPIGYSDSLLATEYDKIKSVAPFSIFFDTYKIVSSTLSNYNATSTNGFDINILGYNNETRTIVTINSSSLWGKFNASTSQETAEASVNYLSIFAKGVIWIAGAYAGIRIIKL